MEIKVETNELKNYKQEMIGLSEDLENSMKQLEEVVWSLTGEWQGETQKALSDRIILVKARYERLIEFLRAYANLLGDFSDEFENYEHETAQRINLI